MSGCHCTIDDKFVSFSPRFKQSTGTSHGETVGLETFLLPWKSSLLC